MRGVDEVNQHRGKVFFVGAGPGDPKLITVKGAELLKEADVIVYDRLVNQELLVYGKKNVELIYCGKLPKYHAIPQESINQILVDHAKLGKRVVRLKGGDPCIFGRVGEEAECCVENHIPFEIVPGITSGVAAPAYAGIPLTHRDLSSSVAIVTGHQREDGKEQDINWKSLARGIDTLVFYMGVHNIALIQKKLIQFGKPPETPVALVRWGTCDNQETLTGELYNIVDRVQEAGFQSPAIIVVGEVVKMREKIAWFNEIETHQYFSEVVHM
ncbi:uroporphyrinogen-III C-methyltransferase [Evansella cellulosilytica]|uniref:Uroporphyrinogen-III C-methyltransferase n=1 Tax=Evansella cellulosilytica (strain ATCC 21833 / DSM 2522 / FERM P-1141 / JCM 9156 / N-4) TaxID=649639 RepID=E6U1U4_EVAC2|nr:uroporphyrinogen-III C-methyltransferase [Evansella cellulosilytica]ADU31591.1 uroporphyrin-III C-methyltransferase [Evansella cellulosilytica DSM 2522]